MRALQQPIGALFFALPIIFMPFSKALTSISTALILLFALFIFYKNSKIKDLFKIEYLLLFAYFILSLVSVFYSTNTTNAWSKILLKLPLFFLPFLVVIKTTPFAACAP